MTRSKIAIVGAGASGIGVAKAFREKEIDFEIIEKTRDFGGNWQASGPASKMYRSAHLISSKSNSQFSDFPMPSDYPDYPNHELMHNYLGSIADHYDLARATRFDTTVENAIPGANGSWTLSFSDGSESQYGGLVVCNGLLRKPLVPNYPGRFSGEELHASDYKTNDDLAGKVVLVVGGGNSGCDIAVDAAQTARKVLHTTRRGYHYMPKFIAGKPTQEWLMEQAQHFSSSDAYWEHVSKTFKLAGFDGQDFGLQEPDHHISEAHPIMNSNILYAIGHGDVFAKPDIAEFDGRSCVFSDGTQEGVDCIIWCTGYDIELPFMDAATNNIKREIQTSFLRMASRQYETLLFVGYLNTPSGIGNVANIMGRFAAAYFGAREVDGSAWHRLQAMIASGQAVDLGEERFMDTDRHAFEVDLWKFIKAVNFMTAKLNSDVASVARDHQQDHQQHTLSVAQ